MLRMGSHTALTGLLTLLWLTGGAPLAFAQHVHIVLDSSGSMQGTTTDGKVKYLAAREATTDYLSHVELPPNATLGLTAFGHNKTDDCKDIEHFADVPSANRQRVVERVNDITPQYRAKTPIADALLAAGDALKDRETTVQLILVSDGIETCGGDPCQVAERLRMQYGFEVFRLDVVGFDIREGREQLECIAAKGGGRYFSAANAAELTHVFKQLTKDSLPPPKKTVIKLSRGKISIPNLSESKVAVIAGHKPCTAVGGAATGWLSPRKRTLEVHRRV